MPTDAASDPALAGLDPGGISASVIDDESERRTHDRRTLRLGIGVTITFLIAMLYDWTLAYLAPIFVIPMLKAPVGPSLGAAARMLLGTFVVFVGGLCSAGLSQVYPAFFLMALFPALFWTFRFGLRGGSVLITLFALCGLILLPLMAGTRIEVGRNVASFLRAEHRRVAGGDDAHVCPDPATADGACGEAEAGTAAGRGDTARGPADDDHWVLRCPLSQLRLEQCPHADLYRIVCI